MGKSPRISGKEVIRRLTKAGFYVSRTKGSHHRLVHADGRRTTVPVHPGETIGVGLLDKIVTDDCRMTMVEFDKLA